jgi:hypothetical protein
MDFDKLREEAITKHKILRVTVYPDEDSVEDEDALTDPDELAKVEFLDVGE